MKKFLALISFLSGCTAVYLSAENKIETDDLKEDIFSVTSHSYEVSDVELFSQDRKKTRFKDLVNSDEPVLLSFLFTTCTTICPMQAAIIASLQKKLQAQSKTLRIISVSIDPDQDTPARIKDYLQKFDAAPNWYFLTGSKGDVEVIQKAFGAYTSNKMSHKQLVFLRGKKDQEWLRIDNFNSSDQLLKEYEKVAKP